MLTDVERRYALAKAFVAEMRARDAGDDAFVYHLALLLRPEGHPTIKLAADSVSDTISPRGNE